jgi:hypothetical protein
MLNFGGVHIGVRSQDNFYILCVFNVSESMGTNRLNDLFGFWQIIAEKVLISYSRIGYMLGSSSESEGTSIRATGTGGADR